MTRKLLVADDNQAILQVLRSQLSGRPDIGVYEEAVDGHEALQKGLSMRPDVAILDLRMPKLNGIEVAKLLKESIPKMKVIIFTMYEDHLGHALTLAAGVHLILPKPAGLAALQQALDALLNESGSAKNPE